jgi:hypothetical protein
MYKEAVPILEEAYEFAKRLDNPGLTAHAASGMALVQGRLGDAKAQADWGRQAVRSALSNEWGICLLSAAYDRGIGLCLEERFNEAELSLDEVDERFGKGRPDWLRQAWQLCKADVLALAGRDRRALTSARRATDYGARPLLHPCFAGQYARWAARAAIADSRIETATCSLERMLGVLDIYDAKDQAEILAAAATLEDANGTVESQKWGEVSRRLADLPESIEVLLRRFGMMGHGPFMDRRENA